MPSLTRIVLLLLFGGVAVFLFIRATAGGGPLYYFLSAVFVGMAIASLQRSKGGPGQGGPGQSGRGQGGPGQRGRGPGGQGQGGRGPGGRNPREKGG